VEISKGVEKRRLFNKKSNQLLTKLWVGLINKNSSMINHPPQRKLCRSFGSQPVGCLVGPRQPEAGVGVQVTQAQSSRWTFLSSDDGDPANWRIGELATCRPADLPTCRPADLPTCRPADLPTCRIWSRVTTGVPARSTSSSPISGGA
jgi:hypothetical protein